VGHEPEHAGRNWSCEEAISKTISGKPVVTGYFHEPTFSIVYLVEDPATKAAAIIDPVLDYD